MTPKHAVLVACALGSLGATLARGDCPADFNQDCAVTLADFSAFRDVYTAGDLAADLNGDGVLSLADFMRFRDAYVAGCAADSDGDGIPDAFETGDGIGRPPCAFGTDPHNPDTDGDGLEDGEEVYGTPAGLDLAALGANPLRKDIFIEADWTEDAYDGLPHHSHRPSAAAVSRIVQAFADAPVANPYGGAPGISLHIDYGQGGAFTGGNLVPDSPLFYTFDWGFNDVKSKHFDPRRKGYFHYALFAHRYNSPSNGSSGVAEILGDDFMVTLWWRYDDHIAVANTIMHELGHNLGLRHGGFENVNRKPNYNSVMNYNHQFPGIDTDCDGRGDGVLDYSRGTNPNLNENNLDERAGICGVPIDWNANGVLESSIARNINCPPGEWRPCGTQSGCDDSGCGVLRDHDDWAAVRYDTLRGGDLWREVVECDAPLPD